MFWFQRKEEGDVPFGIEDLLYYIKTFQEQHFDLDFGAIKQYFPVKLVLSGIFKIFQDLFGNFDWLCVLDLSLYTVGFIRPCICLTGLRFEEFADPEVWHCDVRLFSVIDLSSGDLLGYFYLDMYKRFVFDP